MGYRSIVMIFFYKFTVKKAYLWLKFQNQFIQIEKADVYNNTQFLWQKQKRKIKQESQNKTKNPRAN